MKSREKALVDRSAIWISRILYGSLDFNLLPPQAPLSLASLTPSLVGMIYAQVTIASNSTTNMVDALKHLPKLLYIYSRIGSLTFKDSKLKSKHSYPT